MNSGENVPGTERGPCDSCSHVFQIDDYDNDPLVWHGGLKARSVQTL